MTDAEAEQLLHDNAELRAQVAKLTGQFAKLTDRVGELLAVAQRKQRKPLPEKPAEPAQAPLAVIWQLADSAH